MALSGDLARQSSKQAAAHGPRPRNECVENFRHAREILAAGTRAGPIRRYQKRPLPRQLSPRFYKAESVGRSLWAAVLTERGYSPESIRHEDGTTRMVIERVRQRTYCMILPVASRRVQSLRENSGLFDTAMARRARRVSQPQPKSYLNRTTRNRPDR